MQLAAGAKRFFQCIPMHGIVRFAIGWRVSIEYTQIAYLRQGKYSKTNLFD